MYVVAPIPIPKMRPLLTTIAPQKLLIIDRYLPMPKEYSYISQEFEENTYARLVELLPEINRYRKVVLFFKDDADYPTGVFNAFNKFVEAHGINGEVQEKYTSGSIKKNNLYFFISDTFLWEVLRDARNNEYVVGRDIGLSLIHI